MKTKRLALAVFATAMIPATALAGPSVWWQSGMAQAWMTSHWTYLANWLGWFGG